MTMWRLGPAVLACVLAAACEGDPRAPGGGGGGDAGGPVIVLRGGERIAWDQPIESPQIARSQSYTLYVDGVPAPLAETRCADVRSAGGVECSGRLPPVAAGRHTLELTATYQGVESPRSAPLVVSMGAAASAALETGDRVPPPGDGSPPSLCLGPAGDCYDAALVASGFGRATSPVVTPEGHVFFIEDESRVRVVESGVLAGEPALVRRGPRSRLTALAVAPDFSRSRRVFAAESEALPGGGLEELTITRYRERVAAFGEGASIVAGLRLPAGGVAPITADETGFLYVALPAAGGALRGSAGTALGGVVLRFDSDGAVPGANPLASPVLARGFGRPSSLGWDPAARTLWLAGWDPGRTGTVLALRPGDAHAQWPWVPSAVAPGEQVPAGPGGAAFATSGAGAPGAYAWVTAPDGPLYRLALQAGPGAADLHHVGVDALGEVSGMGAAPDGSIVLATMSPAGGAAAGRLWRLRPRSPH